MNSAAVAAAGYAGNPSGRQRWDHHRTECSRHLVCGKPQLACMLMVPHYRAEASTITTPRHCSYLPPPLHLLCCCCLSPHQVHQGARPGLVILATRWPAGAQQGQRHRGDVRPAQQHMERLCLHAAHRAAEGTDVRGVAALMSVVHAEFHAQGDALHCTVCKLHVQQLIEVGLPVQSTVDSVAI